MKHKTKANRLSKQNYCTFCPFRTKTDKGVTCVRYNTHISQASKVCILLKPFDNYKEVREKP
jgi:hypothetical protein